MPLLPFEQRTPEWLAARRGLVTASVAAAILGVGPDGPLWAYNKICCEAEPDNKHMAWGREFEATAISAYEVLSGWVVDRTGLWIHPTEAWLGSSPDGLVGEDGLVEVKCPGAIPGQLPPHHEIQMRVQLACVGRDWCDYFAWSQTGAFCTRVVRDMTLEKDIVAKLHDFYWKHVDTRTPPARRKAARAGA